MRSVNRAAFFVLLVLCLVFATGCTSLEKGDTIYQVSLLNALLQGEYDGFVSVGALKEHGEIGIGTFDTLDGEMIMLDGVVYKAKADGTVEVVSDDVLVPFAVVTPFVADVLDTQTGAFLDIEELKTSLDSGISQTTGDFNRFYVAKVRGTFSHVRVRSVPSQEKPYQPLSVIAESQREFAYEQVEGTIVAFRSPDYVQGINLPGWHLHFLSKDGQKGGHLLEVSTTFSEVQIGDMRSFHLMLPSSGSFAAMDISEDRSEETQAIEGVVRP